MSERTSTSMLRDAINEIQGLRRTNEILQAKVDTMDLMALFLRTEPRYPSQGMTQDIAWILEREIDRINQARVNE